MADHRAFQPQSRCPPSCKAISPDGQLAIAELEDSVLAASAQAKNATIDDLGSAAFMVDLASMAHETHYTRLFRS
jgi:urease accessory protein